MRKVRQYLKRATVMLLAAAMIFGVAGRAVPVEAAKKAEIVVSNNRSVLVVGRTYYVKNEGATNFKSSNKAVATISSKGKITLKKGGYTTISAKINGKTVKTKFLVVSKNGVTSLQTKIDKMLAAENVSRITIYNQDTAQNYTIAKGNYSKKTLTVDVPLSDVTNNGVFKKINLRDVKDGTFINYAKNTINITDNSFRFIDYAKGSKVAVAEQAKGTVVAAGTKLEVASEGKLTLEAEEGATIETVTVKGGEFTLDASKTPEVKEVVVEGKADIVVTGETKADVPIIVKAEAEGTTVESSCSVSLTLEATTEIKLTDAAGGSKIETAENVAAKITVADSIDEKVSVGVVGSDKVQEVEAGKAVEVAEDGKVAVEELPTTGDDKTDSKDDSSTSGGSTGGGSIGGGGGGYYPPTQDPVTPPATPAVTGKYENNKTTYTLSNADSFEELQSVTFDLSIKKGNSGLGRRITHAKTPDDVRRWDKVKSAFADKTASVASWTAITSKTMTFSEGNNTIVVVVSGEKGSATKQVNITGFITAEANVTVTHVENAIETKVEFIPQSSIQVNSGNPSVSIEPKNFTITAPTYSHAVIKSSTGRVVTIDYDLKTIITIEGANTTDNINIIEVIK